jgi:hypothetical protein
MVSLTCSNLPFCLIRLESGYEAVLPTSLSGERFLEMFSSHNDPFTKIKPDRVYDVKVPAAHPIYENFRVKAFATLLTAVHTDMQLEALGELMYQVSAFACLSAVNL